MESVRGSAAEPGKGSSGFFVSLCRGTTPLHPPRRVEVRLLWPANGTGRDRERCRRRAFPSPSGEGGFGEVTSRIRKGRRACRPTAPFMLPRTVSPSCWERRGVGAQLMAGLPTLFLLLGGGRPPKPPEARNGEITLAGHRY